MRGSVKHVDSHRGPVDSMPAALFLCLRDATLDGSKRDLPETHLVPYVNTGNCKLVHPSGPIDTHKKRAVPAEWERPFMLLLWPFGLRHPS